MGEESVQIDLVTGVFAGLAVDAGLEARKRLVSPRVEDTFGALCLSLGNLQGHQSLHLLGCNEGDGGAEKACRQGGEKFHDGRYRPKQFKRRRGMFVRTLVGAKEDERLSTPTYICNPFLDCKEPSEA